MLFLFAKNHMYIYTFVHPLEGFPTRGGMTIYRGSLDNGNPYAFCASLRCGFLPTRGATTKNLGEVGILWRPRSVQRPWYPVEPWSVIPEFCNFTWQFLMDHEVIPWKDVKMSPMCRLSNVFQSLSFNMVQSLDQADDQRSQNIGIWSSLSFCFLLSH